MCREFGAINISQMVKSDIVNPYVTSNINSWRIPFLKELISLRDGYASSDLTKRELMDIIDYVSTS